VVTGNNITTSTMPRRAASGDSPRSVGEERDDAEEAYFLAVGDYKHGSITRIKLKHFLTYSDVEVHPKPRYEMMAVATIHCC
jgi:hypothetical protein